MQFVDEDDVTPGGVDQLLDHRLEPLLEFAAILGAGQQLADVERDDFLASQRIGDVAVDDPLRETFDDGRLADAGLADQHGIVLGATRQHLHHPANFLVAPDHGVELSGARRVGKVAGEAFQRLVLLFGGLVDDAMRPADFVERRTQFLRRQPFDLEQLAGGGALLFRERQQQVFGGDVRVAEFLGDAFAAREHLRQRAVERRRHIDAAPLAGKRPDLSLDPVGDARHRHAGLGQQRLDDAFVLCQQRREQVGVVDDGIPAGAGLLECRLHGFASLERETIRTQHVRTLQCGLRWRRTGPPPRGPGAPARRRPPGDWQGLYPLAPVDRP